MKRVRKAVRVTFAPGLEKEPGFEEWRAKEWPHLFKVKPAKTEPAKAKDEPAK